MRKFQNKLLNKLKCLERAVDLRKFHARGWLEKKMLFPGCLIEFPTKIATFFLMYFIQKNSFLMTKFSRNEVPVFHIFSPALGKRIFFFLCAFLEVCAN